MKSINKIRKRDLDPSLYLELLSGEGAPELDFIRHNEPNCISWDMLTEEFQEFITDKWDEIWKAINALKNRTGKISWDDLDRELQARILWIEEQIRNMGSMSEVTFSDLIGLVERVYQLEVYRTQLKSTDIPYIKMRLSKIGSQISSAIEASVSGINSSIESIFSILEDMQAQPAPTLPSWDADGSWYDWYNQVNWRLNQLDANKIDIVAGIQGQRIFIDTNKGKGIGAIQTMINGIVLPKSKYSTEKKVRDNFLKQSTIENVFVYDDDPVLSYSDSCTLYTIEDSSVTLANSLIGAYDPDDASINWGQVRYRRDPDVLGRPEYQGVFIYDEHANFGEGAITHFIHPHRLIPDSNKYSGRISKFKQLDETKYGDISMSDDFGEIVIGANQSVAIQRKRSHLKKPVHVYTADLMTGNETGIYDGVPEYAAKTSAEQSAVLVPSSASIGGILTYEAANDEVVTVNSGKRYINAEGLVSVIYTNDGYILRNDTDDDLTVFVVEPGR